VSLFYLLKLSFQSLGLLTRTTIKHQKAKATFEKTLILHGIPLETAQELSKAYPNPINEILHLMSIRNR
jgi:hypothetical protein